MEQFPLGLIREAPIRASGIPYSSTGDLFLFLTDGISEVENNRDEQFGLGRLEQLMMQGVTQPLPRIWDTIQQEVGRHGVQADDQTILLIRVRH